MQTYLLINACTPKYFVWYKYVLSHTKAGKCVGTLNWSVNECGAGSVSRILYVLLCLSLLYYATIFWLYSNFFARKWVHCRWMIMRWSRMLILLMALHAAIENLIYIAELGAQNTLFFWYSCFCFFFSVNSKLQTLRWSSMVWWLNERQENRLYQQQRMKHNDCVTAKTIMCIDEHMTKS